MYLDYLTPESINDALQILQQQKGKARIIAGGTDLLLDIESKKHNPEVLVDITRIPEIRGIQTEGNFLIIGAGVTHNEAAKSALVNEKAQVLAEASRSVGSLQIRNTATIAGNVVNAQPAADAAVALVALGATAVITSSDFTREVPVEELYAGVGKSKVNSNNEIVTKIIIPALQPGEGSAFTRLAQRKALALPMLNVAVMVSIAEDKFQRVSIVMAPVGPQPVRASDSENLLKGAAVNEETIQKAAEAALNHANPRSSALRGSAEYRCATLKVLVRRALETAVARARN